jgi:hypothetical protein
MLFGRKDLAATGPLEIPIPPVPVVVIDGFLVHLHGRTILSAAEVRDMLLDVRNAVWVAQPSIDLGLNHLGQRLAAARSGRAPSA